MAAATDTTAKVAIAARAEAEAGKRATWPRRRSNCRSWTRRFVRSRHDPRRDACSGSRRASTACRTLRRHRSRVGGSSNPRVARTCGHAALAQRDSKTARQRGVRGEAGCLTRVGAAAAGRDGAEARADGMLRGVEHAHIGVASWAKVALEVDGPMTARARGVAKGVARRGREVLGARRVGRRRRDVEVAMSARAAIGTVGAWRALAVVGARPAVVAVAVGGVAAGVHART